MPQFCIDTEYLDYAIPGGTAVQLISLGVVDDTGRELYLENADFDWDQSTPGADLSWLNDNVRPHLHGPGHPDHVSHHQMGVRLAQFVAARPSGPTDPLEFWAWVAAYDWAAVAGLYGRLMDRPTGWPLFCHDLKQAWLALPTDPTRPGPRELPPTTGTAHNALDDARWDAVVLDLLTQARP